MNRELLGDALAIFGGIIAAGLAWFFGGGWEKLYTAVWLWWNYPN